MMATIAAKRTADAAISLTFPACSEKCGVTILVSSSMAVLISSATMTKPNIDMRINHSERLTFKK